MNPWHKKDVPATITKFLSNVFFPIQEDYNRENLLL
jgi:hypothetical protein